MDDEWYYEDNFEYDYRGGDIENKIWMTTDGDEIPVGELEDDHIRNIIKWLKFSDHYERDEWIELLEEEIEKRNSNMLNF